MTDTSKAKETMMTSEPFDVTVLKSPIGEIAGCSMLENLGDMDEGDADFDPPTAEDLYTAAVALASSWEEYAADGLGNHHFARAIERVALWLLRMSFNHEVTSRAEVSP